MSKFKYFLKKLSLFFKLIMPWVQFGLKAYREHKADLKALYEFSKKRAEDLSK